MKTSGNTILITGGSSGIGLEFAKQLSAKKNTVLITGRNQAKLDAAKKILPDLVTFKSDASNPEDIAKLAGLVTSSFPDLNVLINNAGVMRSTNFYRPNSDLKSLTEEVTTNLNGPIWMSHQFIPHLAAQKSAAIINVSSLLGISPLPLAPVYSATKAGLRSFTICLREQLRHTSIKVFDLAPPATQTDMVEVFEEADLKDFKLMNAATLVRTAILSMEKDQFEIRPGQTGQVHYLQKFAPGILLKVMRKSLDRRLERELKR